MVMTLADMDGNESFDPAALGSAEEVVEERVADDAMMMIKGCKSTKAVTLLLRGANDYMLDEMDRSLHDSLCVVKRVLESGRVVPGRGAQHQPCFSRVCGMSCAQGTWWHWSCGELKCSPSLVSI